jgi:hypothetical protein
VAIGRASGGTPDKPEFFAERKMRPNEVFKAFCICYYFTKSSMINANQGLK